MKNKRKSNEMMAGVFGIIVLIFIIGLFVVFLNMIPNIQDFIVEFLQVDEFMAQVVFFIALLMGILGFSYLAYLYAPKRVTKRKK
jgi:hypothetical protein